MAQVEAAVAVPPELDAFVLRQGLAEADAPRHWQALTGGVSSDIWRVDIGTKTGTAIGTKSLCVKRALAKLKVAAEWHAPLSRNAFEWAWLNFAAGVLPDAVPQPLAHDEAQGLFAMSFLEPASNPLWKQQLLAGQVSAITAAAVGRTLGVLHNASAFQSTLARAFDTGDNFHALRLEPYLLATAQRHRLVRHQLTELCRRTAARHEALVHGDVSPKNILVGPHGPVLLDAECAWYGDPAFDLAFCLNHLLLKRLPRPDARSALAQAFEALVEAYFSAAVFEDRSALESRAAHLLPALFLARVDGKSPVEYITEEADRDKVRAAAIPWILQPPPLLSDLARSWFRP